MKVPNKHYELQWRDIDTRYLWSKSWSVFGWYKVEILGTVNSQEQIDRLIAAYESM